MPSHVRIHSSLLINATVAMLCIGLSQPVLADQVSGPWAANAPQQSIMLAQASPATANTTTASAKKSKPEGGGQMVDAPWYGRNNVHKYLGLASLGAAAITMISPKKEGGPHEFFADASAALGGAAVATGAYAHWGDLDFTWQDPDTKHALFGLLGTLGFAVAVAQGGEGGHAGAGALGAISMITAIKYTW